MTTTITRVQVEGYRSIERMDMPLGRTHILIGPNGGGKSNLLTFLQFVRRLWSQSLRLTVGMSGGASALLHAGAQRRDEITFRLEARHVDGRETAYAGTLGAAAGDALVLTEERVEERQPGGAWSSTLLASGQNEAQLLPRSKIPAFEPAGAVARWVSQIAFFHFHDTSMLAPLRRHSQQADDRELRPDGENLAAFLHRLARSPGEAEQAAFARITSLVQRIAPSVERLEPTLVVPEMGERSAVRLDWVDVNDTRFGVHQLSDGTLRAIALFTALSQPLTSLPGIIAIDEPEVGLHPAALALFAGLVRSVSSRCQVIIATQSSALLDHFLPEQVVVVEAPRGASAFRTLDPKELEGWLEDYTLAALYDKNVLGGRP